MIICVCRYRRGHQDKLIHMSNRMVITGDITFTYEKNLEILQCAQGEFRRQGMVYAFASEHGWEKVEDTHFSQMSQQSS